MGESPGDAKFSCPNCGRDFRWKPELAGKRATCKCGKPITVPLEPPGANSPPPAPQDPFAAFDVAGEEPLAPAAPPPPPRAPAYGAAGGVAPTSVSAQLNCPVCGTPALPTAFMCLKCGYNFHTGQSPAGYRGGRSSHAGDGGGRFAAEMYHKAALTSWVAPLLVVVTNCCCVGAIVRMSGSATSALFVAIFQLLLIIAGLGLGIFALTGVKRNGPEKIFVPASIGIALNALIILANVVVIMLAISGHNLLNRLKKLPPPPAPGATTTTTSTTAGKRAAAPLESWEIESAFIREPGWVGAVQYHGATITLVTLSDNNDVGRSIASRVDESVLVALLTVDNSQGEAAFPVDPTGGNVVIGSGEKFDLPDIAKLLGEKKSDGDALVAPPPFDVPKGGQLENKVIFLPPEVEPKQISRVTISIDGHNMAVQGRYLSVKEKQKAFRGGK